MRTLRLARIAAEAEGVRLRAQARRTMVRAVLGLIALGFLAAAIAFGHVAVWFALRQGAGWADWAAASAVAGGDLAIAVVLVLLAARSTPGQVEREALLVRQRALDGATSGVALVTELVRLVANVLPRKK